MYIRSNEQCFILKAIEAQQLQLNKSAPTASKMESIVGILTDLFTTAVSKAVPDVPDPPIVIALSGNNPKFGDYQCNSAMPISNIYKQLGELMFW